jgi:hypothetical protein
VIFVKGVELINKISSYFRRRSQIFWPLLLVFLAIILFGFKEPVLNFISKNKWLLLVVVTAIILYISWGFSEVFNKYKQNLRRTWYFIFILGVVLLLDDMGFNADEWQRYTLLAAMFIFVDLALFLTPSIKKIGGAEMEQITEVENVNEEMKKVIIQTQNRSWQFTGILDILDISKFGSQDWQSFEEYRTSLTEFLAIYGDKCRQEITVFKFEHFRLEIGSIIGVDLVQEQIEALDNQEIVFINTKTVLIPFLDRDFPVIISIESEKDIIDIDTDYVVNLALIHSWLKK